MPAHLSHRSWTSLLPRCHVHMFSLALTSGKAACHPNCSHDTKLRVWTRLACMQVGYSSNNIAKICSAFVPFLKCRRSLRTSPPTTGRPQTGQVTGTSPSGAGAWAAPVPSSASAGTGHQSAETLKSLLVTFYGTILSLNRTCFLQSLYLLCIRNGARFILHRI